MKSRMKNKSLLTLATELSVLFLLISCGQAKGPDTNPDQDTIFPVDPSDLQNPYITPLTEGHPSNDVKALVSLFQSSKPGFFPQKRKPKNQGALISDPVFTPGSPSAPREAPFILSPQLSFALNHADAVRFCHTQGAQPPSENQMNAFIRAVRYGERHGLNLPNLIFPDSRGHESFWMLEQSTTPGKSRLMVFSCRIAIDYDEAQLVPVRCVQPLPSSWTALEPAIAVN